MSSSGCPHPPGTVACPRCHVFVPVPVRCPVCGEVGHPSTHPSITVGQTTYTGCPALRDMGLGVTRG